jgi:hypothetical protein
MNNIGEMLKILKIKLDKLSSLKKNYKMGQAWWLTAVISANQDVAIRSITDHPNQIVHEISSQPTSEVLDYTRDSN